MTAPTDTAVRTTIDVAATPEHAFDVFTTGIDTWWIRDHHLLPGTAEYQRITADIGLAAGAMSLKDVLDADAELRTPLPGVTEPTLH